MVIAPSQCFLLGLFWEKATKKTLVPELVFSGTKAEDLCGTTRIDIRCAVCPLTFPRPETQAPLITGGVPVALLRPRPVRCALGSPFTRRPPAAIPPSAALWEAFPPGYSSSSLVYRFALLNYKHRWRKMSSRNLKAGGEIFRPPVGMSVVGSMLPDRNRRTGQSPEVTGSICRVP